MPTDSSAAAEAFALLRSVPYGRLAASRRALPFVAPARHIVLPGAILLRMHAGLGYHPAGSGTVVAYGADNLTSGDVGDAPSTRWSVQCVGTATIVRPTDEERALFGSQPGRIDGQHFEPVHLRLVPTLTTVHVLDVPAGQRGQHAASTII